MTDKPPAAPRKSKPPQKRTSSGEQPAVVAFRARMESFTEYTIPLMKQATEAIEQAALSTAPPANEAPQESVPAPQSIPVFVEPEMTPIPTTRPQNVLAEEPDPFSEKKKP